MAPLLLALLMLFGGLADPEPQRDADDYPVQVALWQIITSRMVDLVDEVVTRDEVWGVVVAPPGRQEWWDRITALADSAPRPTPSDGPTSLNQEYYSAAVAPIRAGLNSLAMAMRTARRDDARVALDSLRQYLPADSPPSAACSDGRPERRLEVRQSDPSIGDYIEQSVRAFESDPWVQAYALGWRCDPADPTQFLRRYWAERLARADGGSVGQLSAEDWRTLFSQASRLAADDGAANVGTAFVLRTDLPSLSPSESVVVHTRLYRAAMQPLFTGEIDLSGAPRCALFLYQPTLQDTPDAFVRLTRFAVQSPTTVLVDSLWRSCVSSVTSVWVSGYQTVDRWTPPPQCQAFHARLREGLNLLAGATSAINTALQNPTWAPADQLGYVAASRTLAAAGAQGINDAVALDPNRNCG
jgi:hypothetical protein